MSIGNVRYTSVFYSFKGTKWTVEIYDEDLGAPGAGTFSVDELTLSYNGNQDDILFPVIGSEIRTGVQIGEDAFFYVMILQIVADHEERFSVKVTRGTDLYWTGWLLQDLFTDPDETTPYFIELSATDGMARLKDIDYDNAGTLYTGEDRVTDHLIKILTKIGLTEYWGADDIFLTTACNWYEDSHHAPGGTYDPLYLTKIQHEAFQQADAYGVVKAMNCYDVLTQILKQFNARIIHSNGKFYVLPVAEHGDATFPFSYNYNKTGTYKSGQTNWSAVVSDATRMAGGQFTYMPGLLKAQTTYKFKQGTNPNNLLPPSYDYDEDATLGNIQGGGDEKLVFSGDLEVDLLWEDAGTAPELYIVAVYELNLVVGTYYLDNEDYDQWIEDNTKFYAVDITLKAPPQNKHARANHHIGFITPEIPASGAGTFDFKFKQWEDRDGNVLDLSAYSYTLTATCHNFNLNLVIATDELQQGDLLFESYSTSDGATKVASRSVKDLGETVLGDGPNSYSSGRLTIYNSGTSAFENSAAWSVDQTGTTYDINQLRCREALAIQRLPTWRYDGKVYEGSAIYGHSILQMDSTNFMSQRVTLTASKDEWNGVWVRI